MTYIEMIKKVLITFGFIVLVSSRLVIGQILYTESFSVLMDSTKKITGTILPNLEIQTQKELFTEFENLADVTFQLDKQSVFTIANKFEFSTFGKQLLLSDGYVYLEYQNYARKFFSIEPYTQFVWSLSRGLQQKYALGSNARFNLFKNGGAGLFAGLGPFYEYEIWNYSAVPDDSLPINTDPIAVHRLKLGTYINLKWRPIKDIELDLSSYHQGRFNELFTSPRIAASFGITWEITQRLGLAFIYQTIYDYQPIVPIRNDFHKVITGVSLSF